MNRVLSKTMRTSEYTLDRLDCLKGEVQKLYPDEYICYDLVINFLLDFKQNIKKNYVERTLYDEISDIKNNQMDHIKQLEEQLKTLEGEYSKNIENLENTIQNQGTVIEGYKNSISERDKQIKTLNSTNQSYEKKLEISSEKIMDLEKENHSLKNENQRLSNAIDQDYFSLYDLKCLVTIINFLSKPLNRKRFFTAKQIIDKQSFWNQEEILNALALAKFNCFPIRVIRNQNNILIYGYQKI